MGAWKALAIRAAAWMTRTLDVEGERQTRMLASACGLVLLKSFKDYYDGYIDSNGKRHPGYVELIDQLRTQFPLKQTIEGE